KAAVNALNDTANYPQGLARQIANGVTNSAKALARLDEIAASISDSAGSGSDYVTAGTVHQAWYAPLGIERTFSSTYILNTDPTTPGQSTGTDVTAHVPTGGKPSSTVALKENQSVYLEVLSPEVAHGIDGFYYVKVNGTYVQADTTEEQTTTGVNKTLDDGTAYTGLIVKTFSVVLKPSENETVTYLTIANYYIPKRGDDQLVFIEYTLRNGTIVDSDGNVTIPEGTEAAEEKWTPVEQSGSTYALSGIVGKDTTVTLMDRGYVDDETGDFHESSIVNASEAPSVVGDTIALVTASGTDIGTEDDPFVTAPYTEGAESEISFVSLEDPTIVNIITGDANIHTEGTARLSDDLLIIDGATLTLDATEDIIYTTIDVSGTSDPEDQTVLDLTARRDVIGISKSDGTEGHLAVGAGSEAALKAVRDNIYQNIELADGTGANAGGEALIATVGSYFDQGAYEVESGSVIGGAANVGDNAKLTIINYEGDAIFDTIDATAGSTVSVTTETGIEGNAITGTDDASFTFTTNGDVNTADHYLIVDLPEGNPLTIVHVDDYYLWGVEAVDPATAPGRDETGE
ncbi:MAG: hypothetical protein IJH42_06605, partial [Atopobiaceae bacterium]|nr:hypothetical protein [Atopobiaceae bacterium]